MKDFKDSFWMIALLVGIVALTWVIPLLVDLFKAYRFHRRRMDMLEKLLGDKSRQPPLTTQDLKDLLASNFVPASPSGLIGLSRGLMALTIATSIAIALIALIGVGTHPDGLIRTIVTTLLAAFTTIVGFYFGARTAESAQSTGHDNAVAAANMASNTSGDQSVTPPAGGDVVVPDAAVDVPPANVAPADMPPTGEQPPADEQPPPDEQPVQ